MITIQHTQEGLSRAFVYGVCAAAGLDFRINDTAWDYGFDGQFCPVKHRGVRRVTSGYPLDFQLKASTTWSHEAQDVVYDLANKTYNDIVGREPTEIGAILILLCLPLNQTEWIEFSEDYLKLQRCCYWMRLAGDVKDNEDSKTRIRIPRTNLLNVDSLRAAMEFERARRSSL